MTEPGLDQDAEATHHPPAYYYPPRPPQYHYPHYAPPTPTTPAPIGIYWVCTEKNGDYDQP